MFSNTSNLRYRLLLPRPSGLSSISTDCTVLSEMECFFTELNPSRRRHRLGASPGGNPKLLSFWFSSFGGQSASCRTIPGRLRRHFAPYSALPIQLGWCCLRGHDGCHARAIALDLPSARQLSFLPTPCGCPLPGPCFLLPASCFLLLVCVATCVGDGCQSRDDRWTYRFVAATGGDEDPRASWTGLPSDNSRLDRRE